VFLPTNREEMMLRITCYYTGNSKAQCQNGIFAPVPAVRPDRPQVAKTTHTCPSDIAATYSAAHSDYFAITIMPLWWNLMHQH
jgi:hypothetical protein